MTAFKRDGPFKDARPCGTSLRCLFHGVSSGPQGGAIPALSTADLPVTLGELRRGLRMVTIEKSQEYLAADEMIARLTCNVQTVPHRHLCGSPTFPEHAKDIAASTLVRMACDSRQALSCDAFV